MIGPLSGRLRLMRLPLGNIGERGPAFKIEIANGAGFVLERSMSMKTRGAGTTNFLHQLSINSCCCSLGKMVLLIRNSSCYYY